MSELFIALITDNVILNSVKDLFFLYNPIFFASLSMTDCGICLPKRYENGIKSGHDMIKNLSEKEESALRDFIARVTEKFRDNYLFSLMFGSKARGDAHEGSDLDVAVVLEQVDFSTRRAIYELK